ncbi:hypothetical protein [Nostoc sp.]|uniref:hypothetical protein n=1 Tax=Nostoc sp. TaxID=1180 RepID=UPI002FF73189
MVQEKSRSVDSKSRGWWTNITICFGDFDLSICRDKAQNSADLLVESSIWEGKTPFEVPNGNSEFSTSFYTATTVAQWHKILIGDWVQERKLSFIAGDWGLGTGYWVKSLLVARFSHLLMS